MDRPMATPSILIAHDGAVMLARHNRGVTP